MKFIAPFAFALLSLMPPQFAQGQTVDFKIVEIADELNHPWALAFLPDGDYLITEREGDLIRVSSNGQKTEIKNVPEVYAEGQGGLLDVVLHPEFDSNGYIYFSYAASDKDTSYLANTEVARAKLDLYQNTLSEFEIIFTALPKVEGGNHWGSRLLFTPEGYLFITLGERFDYEEDAQKIQNHLGTVIRLNWDGSIPNDNPFINTPNAKPEIYSYGHRNPQGIALHPQTGEVWIHEHGPKGGDEINILKAGANYGWPKVSYGVTYWGRTISEEPTAEGVTDPILQWTPSIAPSGMTFYNGDKFPEWEGDLFVGALVLRHLRKMELNGSDIVNQEKMLENRKDRIRDVRTGPDGYIYVLTDDRNGKLLRLEPQ